MVTGKVLHLQASIGWGLWIHADKQQNIRSAPSETDGWGLIVNAENAECFLNKKIKKEIGFCTLHRSFKYLETITIKVSFSIEQISACFSTEIRILAGQEHRKL